ncbi:hypothetical protein EV715DRAFT_262665 [Schizophyllum commune]
MSFSPLGSPLTPAPETPFPTKKRNMDAPEDSVLPPSKIKSILPKLGAQGQRRSSSSSSVPGPSGSKRGTGSSSPSSHPSGISISKEPTSIAASDAASQQGSTIETGIVLNSPDEANRAHGESAQEPAPSAPQEEKEGAGESSSPSLEHIHAIDEQYSKKDFTLPEGFESLESKLRLYARKTRLEPEDVVDCLSYAGVAKRFQIQYKLLDDVEATMEEFKALLSSLRLFDPERAEKPSWKADPTGALGKVFKGARTLAALNAAWMGFSSRCDVAPGVFAKYLARAYAARGALSGEVPGSPVSTAPSIYAAAEQYEEPMKAVKYLLGSWRMKDRPSYGGERGRAPERNRTCFCKVQEVFTYTATIPRDLAGDASGQRLMRQGTPELTVRAFPSIAPPPAARART